MRNCGCHSHNGFALSPEGLAQREYTRPGVDFMGTRFHLDRPGSVSALIEIEIDAEYDPGHIELNRREIHNGS